MDAPINVWNEIRVTTDGISITLLSESTESGAVVEDETWFTFSELESQSPSRPISLRLSNETQSAIAKTRRDAMKGQILDSAQSDNKSEMFNEVEADLYFPDEGDVLIDDNPASWSDDTRVVVEEVTDAAAEQYVVQGTNEGTVVPIDEQAWNDETVATANPSYPSVNRVVLGHYEGSVKTYAFPIDRLVEE